MLPCYLHLIHLWQLIQTRPNTALLNMKSIECFPQYLCHWPLFHILLDMTLVGSTPNFLTLCPLRVSLSWLSSPYMLVGSKSWPQRKLPGYRRGGIQYLEKNWSHKCGWNYVGIGCGMRKKVGAFGQALKESRRSQRRIKRKRDKNQEQLVSKQLRKDLYLKEESDSVKFLTRKC